MLAGLRARLALAGGFELHEVDSGAGAPASYLVTRWNLARPLADLAAVEAFVNMVSASGATSQRESQ